MSGILQFISTIAPPPPAPLQRDYDGYQVCWKIFCFRPASFKFEAVAFALLGLYLGMYFVGKIINGGRAKAAVAPFQSFLSSQFTSIRPLLTSSPALHLVYATGRRNLLCLHTTITLYPLHDIPGLIYNFVKGVIEPTFDPSEGLVFDATLGMGVDGLQDGVGVWAVVEKGFMRDLRQKRWDLTFAKLTEKPSFPITHALFQEHVDVTDIVLKTPNVGVTELLADPVTAGVLKYLLITDAPALRPAKGPLAPKSKSRHIILSVRKPSNKEQEEAVKAWLQVTLNLADLLARPGLLKPDVVRKLAKTRQQVDEELAAQYKKEQNEENPPAETAEDRRLAKKKAERAAMSEKELKKAEELDRKRELRKMQKKGVAK
ncbi:uncharacterized protein IAS62_002219 [Cryptococcus decagattii]|uniref:DUF1682-domain-containing protein n=1 Tax=Cryptococcus decagattii TaxID=1859122 RepID=A0ABZ2AQY9_9TREE